MSLYTAREVNIYGGSSTMVAGDQTVHNHGSSSEGFKQLQQQVATNALHNSGEVSDQPKCHPGTRVAILDHLFAWAAALTYTYPILWLHGPAGSGKSAIFRTIAQMLYDNDLLIASFFFFRTAAGRNTSNRFVATIAYQLALSIPSTRLQIEQAIERNPLIFSLSLWDQVQHLIISPLRHACASPSFNPDRTSRIIVVDGLDECQNPDKQVEILDVLCRILQHLPIPFALLVASRPEHHIRGAFNFGVLNKSSTRLFLDNSYNPDADIKQYLVDRFHAIRQQHPLRSYLPQSSWPPEDVIHKLIAKASGQFIYVSTVDKFISSSKHDPAKRLNIIIGILNAGTLKPFEQLDILYATIFHTIDQEDLSATLRVLGLILVPESNDYPCGPNTAPRSPAYVEHLLQFKAGEVRRLLFDLGSLLIVGHDDQNIRFFHASLSDYLFDRSRSGQFWIDVGTVYADLAEYCIRQLLTSTDVYFFFVKYIQVFLSEPTPTLGLCRAIINCDLEKVVNFSENLYPNGLTDLCPVLLEKVKKLPYPDVERLFAPQFLAYQQLLTARVKIYFKSIPLKYFLIIFASTWSNTCRVEDTISLPSCWLKIDRENIKCSDGQVSGSVLPFVKNLFNEPNGACFIDENGYADAALYVLTLLHQDSKSKNDMQVTFNDQITSQILAYLFSKSSIHHDLIPYARSIVSNSRYMEYDGFSGVVKDYVQRGESSFVGSVSGGKLFGELNFPNASLIWPFNA